MYIRIEQHYRHQESVCAVYRSRAPHAPQLCVHGHAAVDRSDTGGHAGSCGN